MLHNYKQNKEVQMKACGAACFIKLRGFWFVTVTEIENTFLCWKCFFSISCFLFLCFTFCLSTAGKTKCAALPFHQLILEIKHIKLNVLWMFYYFIPVYETTTSLNLIFFSPLLQLPCSPWSKSSHWAPREWADQPLNTNLLFLLFMSYFCQVWQLIKLK